MIKYFKTNKIIRCSATPLPDKKANVDCIKIVIVMPQ
jgi:hypothetical protein